MLFCSALLIMLPACVPVQLSPCVRANCGRRDECFARGANALEAGRPDEAACYFRQAVALGGQDSQSRIGLGTSLLVLGDSKQARTQFQWVVERSNDDDQRNIAGDWLFAIDNPLPLTVVSLPAQGCPEQASIAQEAASSLRLTLSRFGSFRVIGGSPLSILPLLLGARGGSDASNRFGDELCAKARSRGARVVVALEVICGDIEQPQGPRTLFSGFYKSHVKLTVAAYQASTCELRFALTTTAVGNNILPYIAARTAADIGVSQLVVPLANRLLTGH